MIIGICGLIGSGKDTVANILVEYHNFQKFRFADKMKKAVSILFDWPMDLLNGDTTESREWRNKPDEFWSNVKGEKITPRKVLQLFGTECMQGGFHKNFWVELVRKQLPKNYNVVIADVRFPNEIKMVRELNGQLWQVRRGKLPDWFVGAQNGYIPKDVHSSETQWIMPDNKFDEIIHNNDTIENLHKKVSNLLSK